VALLSVLPQFSTLADLGSGAGFPGLPFAVLRTSCRVLLVEARERRHHFQRAAIRQLGLTNATACRGRVETLDPEPSSLAIAQALGPPRQVLEWMLPWVEVGGLLVIPGGSEPPDLGSPPQVQEPRILHYCVPLGGPRRTAWTARRSS
jgi:16S rRNA (guanine527-N7)-methyltransferase